jgi:hypothetical protein
MMLKTRLLRGLRRSLLGFLGLALTIAVTACGSSASDESTQQDGGITFPTQEASTEEMQAVLRGDLVRQGECLYVISDDDDTTVLPIWPAGYSYRSDDDDIHVLDADGESVAEVGSTVSMCGGLLGEGGEEPPEDLETRTEPCLGPYWIVGEIDQQ